MKDSRASKPAWPCLRINDFIAAMMGFYLKNADTNKKRAVDEFCDVDWKGFGQRQVGFWAGFAVFQYFSILCLLFGRDCSKLMVLLLAEEVGTSHSL